MVRISALHIYPIKSCGGISVDRAEVVVCGFRLDRRFMVVGASGRALTQRDAPAMARIRLSASDALLRLQAPDMPALELPGAIVGRPRFAVDVWDDHLDAMVVDPSADAWFQRVLARPCRLVYLPDDALRAVDPSHGSASDRVSFADAFPFLLVSTASLDDLNQRLSVPVPMNRFRPNLVVTGCGPYAEDTWRFIEVAGIRFRVAKGCSRCAVTTVDQETGEVGKEPLATLSLYRKREGKVFFAQNLIHEGRGTVRVGDPVHVIERR